MAIKDSIFDDNRMLILALRDNPTGEIFERVYKYYYRSLCGYSARYVSRMEEAEEIVQSTMMWLWENRQSLNPDMSLHALLFTIVKNKSWNKLRHDKYTSKIKEVLIARAAEKCNNLDIYFGEDLFDLFTESLEKLPHNYRKCFLMSRIGGKTHVEIAKELNVSKQAVNYNITQALKLLRKALKDYMYLLLYILG